jgi:GT2 family glycosyltransferase
MTPTEKPVCDVREYPESEIVSRPASVMAVVVTYNRKALLLECLRGLSRQTTPLAGIVLVDNASTDGTPEFLYEQGIIEQCPPGESPKSREISSTPKIFSGKPLIYIRMPENTGGAGGFHEGLKRAYQEKTDWIWMMDDDIEPDAHCLEGLLSFSNISRCIHPRKYFLDGTPHTWEGYYDYRTGRRVFQPDISFAKGFSFCTTNTGCFEGMLVHRAIVDKIGYPDKRFFIGLDDSIYGFLAHFHTPVLYVRDPFVIKKAPHDTSNSPISDRSLYYGMRNAFLFQTYINQKIPKYRGLRSFFLVVKFFDYALNILQSRKKRWPAYKVLLRAVKDGVSGSYGKGL